MKVQDLIDQLSEYAGDTEVRAVDAAGSQPVTSVRSSDFDDQPTVEIGVNYW